MEERVRVLWISPFPPTKKLKHAGGQTFNYYFKEFSNDSSFEIKIIALCENYQVREVEKENKGIDAEFIPYIYVSRIKKIKDIGSKINPWNKYAGLFSNYRGSKIIKKCRELKKEGYNPNVVILEWTPIVLMTNDIKKIFPNSKVVASEHDVTFVGYERQKTYYKSALWNIRSKSEKKLELRALKMCDLVVPHNKDNKDILIENGIKKDVIFPLDPFFHDMSRINRKPNSQDILFFGDMSRKENYLSAEWFIDNVMPLLKNKNIKFIILGANPNESLKVKEDERVDITGFVDNIDPYFEKAMCFVAPLVMGAGIKVKVMEALSAGIPVLTNDVGIEGIPAKDNVEYFHCDTAEDYKRVIDSIIDNNLNELVISNNAKTMMKESFLPKQSVEKYKKTIKRMVEQ